VSAKVPSRRLELDRAIGLEGRSVKAAPVGVVVRGPSLVMTLAHFLSSFFGDRDGEQRRAIRPFCLLALSLLSIAYVADQSQGGSAQRPPGGPAARKGTGRVSGEAVEVLADGVVEILVEALQVLPGEADGGRVDVVRFRVVEDRQDLVGYGHAQVFPGIGEPYQV